MSTLRGIASGVDPGKLPDVPSVPGSEPATQGSPFEDALATALKGASAQANESAEKARALASGASDDLHGTMIAMKEAEISVKLVGSIRNKLIDAFHELWRTSV